MRKIVLLLIFTTILVVLKSQTPKLDWSKKIGGISNDVAKSIATGPNCIYSAGAFQGVVDFDPGPGISNLTSAGGSDIFIFKTDAAGNFIWAKRIGGPKDDEANSIVFSEYNAIYITGYFHDTVDFDPDSDSVFNQSSAGLSDIFILGLDTAGNFKWAKRAGGDSADIGFSIAKLLTANLDINITGSFSGTVDFDTEKSVFNLKSAGSLDVFIMKLDYKGNFKWARRMGGSLTDQGLSITSDQWNGIYTCGSFQGSGDFNPNSGTQILTSRGSDDMFFSMIDHSANFKWATGFGGKGSDIPLCIVNSYDLYVTGMFHDTVVFLPQDPFGPNTIISAGLSDIFIAKLNWNDGLWGGFARRMGGIGNDGGFNLIAIGDDIYATGVFNGVADFNPDTGTYNLFSGTSPSAYLLNVDDFYCTFNFATNTGMNEGSGNSLALANINSIYVAGQFSAGANNSDILVNKYSWNSSGVKQYTCINTFSIYPNPSNGIFNLILSAPSKKVVIEVYNALGVMVYKETEMEIMNTIDLSNQSAGLYLVTVSGDSFVASSKVLIKQ